MFVDDAFGHVLHMVTLLCVKLAGKHGYVNLYMIAEDGILAFAHCGLGGTAGSTSTHATGMFWAPVCCMVTADTISALPGLVWPRLASGYPGGRPGVAWGWFDSSSCLTVMLAQGYRALRQHQDLATSNLQLHSSAWSDCMHEWWLWLVVVPVS